MRNAPEEENVFRRNVWINLIFLNCHSAVGEQRADVPSWLSCWPHTSPVRWLELQRKTEAKPALKTKGQSHHWLCWEMVQLVAQRMAPTWIQLIHPSLFISMYLLRVTRPWSASRSLMLWDILDTLRNFLFQVAWPAWLSAPEER